MALRLGPALLLWLAAVAAPTAVVLHEAAKIPIATLVSLFYVGDFTIAAGGDIGTSHTHIWSLAIEEQFYSVWPWIVGSWLRRRTAGRTRAAEFALPVPRASLTQRLTIVRRTNDALPRDGGGTRPQGSIARVTRRLRGATQRGAS